jgi:(1->4)-alpha-D-glucan 1-alpha-D-glucosylmutase
MPHIPTATYRLQFNQGFRFVDGRDLVPYLNDLGITDLYSSPRYKARRGSSHGYDIANPLRVNSELGTEEDFDEMTDKLRHYSMGLLLDTVPNHMAASYENPWWMDVLENGQASAYASYFDINWHPPTSKAAFLQDNRVLLPMLGDFYGNVLSNGELALKIEDTGIHVRYYSTRLPLDPKTYDAVLRRLSENPEAAEILRDIERLPSRDDPETEHVMERRRDKDRIKERLWRAYQGSTEVRQRVDEALHEIASSPDDLDALLSLQAYRLAHWKIGYEEINYRRFFDINNLAALRVEYQPAFEALHPLVLRLIGDGRLQGLRLDHIDGLWDPHQYCERLHDAIARVQPGRTEPFYTVVEKILEPDEPLPPFPGVAGTTGYEWLNAISRVLIDPQGLDPLVQTWRTFTGELRPFAETLIEAKRYVIGNLLASEFATLAQLLTRIAAGHCTTREFSAAGLRDVLEAFVLQFPIYRTYITADRVSDADRHVIAETISAALARESQDQEIFAFLKSVLTLDLVAPGRRTHSRPRVLRFIGKLQQLTGPLMAKSLEDTAFYRDHAVLALNEVGGRPDAGALSPAQFHGQMAECARDWPHGLTATATHDTKRGEDARMRLLALSELAPDWAAAVPEWQRLNNSLLRSTCGSRAPSLAHEFLFYEALLGAWPSGKIDATFVERIAAFMLKAAREGKQQTSWLDPNPEYERALQAFIAGALEPDCAFLAAATPLADRVTRLGALNSLSQLTLKLMMPGVPDFYQGSEFWDLSLVDPDNRRPVDFPARARALARTTTPTDWVKLADSWQDGAIKLALTNKLLYIRRQYQQLFSSGDYRPVLVSGPHADHVLAFARTHAGNAIIVAVGRRFAQLTGDGRRWPRASDWKAELDLAGFDQTEMLQPTSAPASYDRAHLSTLFATIPVAILRANVRQ